MASSRQLTTRQQMGGISPYPHAVVRAAADRCRCYTAVCCPSRKIWGGGAHSGKGSPPYIIVHLRGTIFFLLGKKCVFIAGSVLEKSVVKAGTTKKNKKKDKNSKFCTVRTCLRPNPWVRTSENIASQASNPNIWPSHGLRSYLNTHPAVRSQLTGPTYLTLINTYPRSHDISYHIMPYHSYPFGTVSNKWRLKMLDLDVSQKGYVIQVHILIL